MQKFVVLCEKTLVGILKPENIAAPEADPKPIVAGHVLGVYATAAIAEQAIVDFNCSANHYIVEAIHWKRLTV